MGYGLESVVSRLGLLLLDLLESYLDLFDRLLVLLLQLNKLILDLFDYLDIVLVILVHNSCNQVSR